MTTAKRRALAVWATAVVVYFLAVFHRTTLGVAGLQAADRFDIGAAALAGFTVLQIGVYALMQVPTGLLVDRFGSRRTLTAAAAMMGAGQLLFAVAGSYPLALVARGVLGVGDALTFVSVLRLVAAHYPPRRYATITMLTAALGMVGNLVATLPLTFLLDHAGWTTAFAVVGGLTAVYAVVVALRVRDTPDGELPVRAEMAGPRQVVAQVRRAWAVPGTRLGFWVHFVTMFAPGALGLLWGFPYLVQALGMSEAAAGAVLSLMVVVGTVANPVIGEVLARRPGSRVPMVAVSVGVSFGLWAALLAWPGGRPPAAFAVVAFALLSIGGPMSAVAFAIVRDYNPLHSVGTASGVANVGGFTAITLTSLAVGLLLGGDTAAAGPADFRLAFLTIPVVVLLGAWRTAVWWRRARAAVLAAADRGEDIPVPIRRRSWDLPPARAGARRAAS